MQNTGPAFRYALAILALVTALFPRELLTVQSPNGVLSQRQR